MTPPMKVDKYAYSAAKPRKAKKNEPSTKQVAKPEKAKKNEPGTKQKPMQKAAKTQGKHLQKLIKKTACPSASAAYVSWQIYCLSGGAPVISRT